MRFNHNPKIGVKNLDIMFNVLGTDHVQINSISIKTYNKPEFGIAQIEELDHDNEENGPTTEYEEEVNVNPITVNRIPIGKACSPYEVMQVQTEAGICPIVIIYDTGSEVSLCNYETGPMVVDTKKGNKKVTISTINSIQAKLRKVYKLKVKEDWSLEAIMIPKMKLRLQQQEIPEIWRELDGTWAEQDTYGVSAQILLGADQARFFPHEARDDKGNLMQTEQARLMQSTITGSYIIFGSCGKHSRRADSGELWMTANQVSTSAPEDEEVLISIMDTMKIDDMDVDMDTMTIDNMDMESN